MTVLGGLPCGAGACELRVIPDHSRWVDDGVAREDFDGLNEVCPRRIAKLMLGTTKAGAKGLGEDDCLLCIDASDGQ